MNNNSQTKEPVETSEVTEDTISKPPTRVRRRSRRWLEQDLYEPIPGGRKRKPSSKGKDKEAVSDGGLVGGVLNAKILSPLLSNFGDVASLTVSLSNLFSPSSSIYSSLSGCLSKAQLSFVKTLLTREGVGINIGALVAWIVERERIWTGWYEGSTCVEVEESEGSEESEEEKEEGKDDEDEVTQTKPDVSDILDESNHHRDHDEQHATSQQRPTRIRKLSSKMLEAIHQPTFVQHQRSVSNKRQQPSGWSKDRVMSRYIWCNAYRELDRGTRYFRSQIKKSLPVDTATSKKCSIDPVKHRLCSVLWSAFVYRRANNIDTWISLGGLPPYPYDDASKEQVRALKGEFESIQEENCGFFAKCHIDSGGMRKYKADIDFLMKKRKVKSQTIMNIEAFVESIQKVLMHEGADYDRIKGVCEIVNQMPGIGTFFAWQITCDLLESSVLLVPQTNRVLRTTPFCQLGPGAISGLERILTGLVSAGSTRGGILWRSVYCGAGVCGSRDEDVHALIATLTAVFESVANVLVEQNEKGRGEKEENAAAAVAAANISSRKSRQPRGLTIDAKNLEHSLCEFSKYCNIRENERSAKKRMYRGPRDQSYDDVCCVKCTDRYRKESKLEHTVMVDGFVMCLGCLEVEGVGRGEETEGA
mmetsp:Transcript_13492/g.27524  ORF Transcript_13492/g.27524 Transcript_13492/m.27524 type:complete len:646 (+) Transcript_13492:156-2093(+)